MIQEDWANSEMLSCYRCIFIILLTSLSHHSYSSLLLCSKVRWRSPEENMEFQYLVIIIINKSLPQIFINRICGIWSCKIHQIRFRNIFFPKARNFESFAVVHTCHWPDLTALLYAKEKKYICLIPPKFRVRTKYSHFNVFRKFHSTLLVSRNKASFSCSKDNYIRY